VIRWISSRMPSSMTGEASDLNRKLIRIAASICSTVPCRSYQVKMWISGTCHDDPVAEQPDVPEK
jgi:hypothetical protein